MITKGFKQILSTFFEKKEMYGDKSGEFVCRYWALKVKATLMAEFLY